MPAAAILKRVKVDVVQHVVAEPVVLLPPLLAQASVSNLHNPLALLSVVAVAHERERERLPLFGEAAHLVYCSEYIHGAKVYGGMRLKKDIIG